MPGVAVNAGTMTTSMTTLRAMLIHVLSLRFISVAPSFEFDYWMTLCEKVLRYHI
jgi:hypothetical protein